MAQGDRSCSCEEIARSPFGIIDDIERLARVVCSPRHVNKKNGTLKPGLFPLSHISEKGLSLTRVDQVDEERFTGIADRIAGSIPTDKNVVAGIVTCKMGAVRAVKDAFDLRTFCVFDDPDLEGDNPAHATLIHALHSALPLDDPSRLELRDRLLTFFDKVVVAISDYYQGDNTRS